MTFWDFCCYCVIFFRVQNFHLLGDVKAKKEATSCRLNIEERTSLLTRLLLYNMDFLRRRRRRVKGKMYTENHGVCLSVRAFISGTPWRIWYWNFACIIYICCDGKKNSKKSKKKSFCLFVCLFYLWKRKKSKMFWPIFFAFLISKASLEVSESMVQKSSLKNLEPKEK